MQNYLKEMLELFTKTVPKLWAFLEEFWEVKTLFNLPKLGWVRINKFNLAGPL